VEGGDAELLAAGSYLNQRLILTWCILTVRTDVLGCQHGGVGGGFVTVGLDLHSTSDTGNGFATRQIGNVDEGVVERSENAGNAENKLALFSLLTHAPSAAL
jgi:hypothetical protein